MRVGVVGAGALGGFLAAELSASGTPVVVIVRRARALDSPLRAARVDGRALVTSSAAVITDDFGALGDVDVCLVAVKSYDTRAVAQALAPALSAGAPVISFQNGLGNVARLREALGSRVSGGVVTYNVFVDERGVRRQASAGRLLAGHLNGAADRRLEALRRAFHRAGETLELRRDGDRILTGKLLLNLNNGICAATGLGIAASLRDTDARWCFAQCVREGLRCMRRAGLRPARVTALPPGLLASALLLPDGIVLPMARGLTRVAPEARSSTLQDLERGRATEIDELNGAIVEIAARAGAAAPLNELVTRVVHEHERAVLAGRPLTFIPAAELRARMQRRLLDAPGHATCQDSLP